MNKIFKNFCFHFHYQIGIKSQNCFRRRQINELPTDFRSDAATLMLNVKYVMFLKKMCFHCIFHFFRTCKAILLLITLKEIDNSFVFDNVCPDFAVVSVFSFPDMSICSEIHWKLGMNSLFAKNFMFLLMSYAIFVQWTFLMDLKTFWLSEKIHIFWFKNSWIFWKNFIDQIRILNIACNLTMLLKKILLKFQFFPLFLFGHIWLFLDWPIGFCGFRILENFKQKLRQMLHFPFLTHLYKTSNRGNCLFYINF